MLNKHALILSIYDEEIQNTKNLLQQLSKYSHDTDVNNMITKLNDTLNKNCGKDMYISSVCQLVNEYKTILKTPISFGHKPCELTEKKIELENLYDQRIGHLKQKWNIVDSRNVIVSCPVCLNSDATLFEIDDVGRKTCVSCSSEIQTLEIGNTSLDYNRATVTGKFVYNRTSHFQDCMKQFQGKQNCKIPESVYADLETKFSMYRLLLDSDNPTIKYSKITKQHILMFLKELKYTKQYENVNVIYSTITGKSIDNISHIEKYLLDDFKELVTLYDNLHSKDKSEELDRKNFLNVQYLLFQLLRRHGYNCKIDDFSILKTTDRKMFHDKICCNLFRQLGWNFTPVF